jgi:hypothetical protein
MGVNQEAHARVPIKTTFKPLPAMVLPIWSMSIVISASFAIAESEMTAGDAAVSDVSSLASIDSLVERMLVPFSLISTTNVDPVGAVLTEARTAVSVKAKGARKVTLFEPTVRLLISSEQAITKSTLPESPNVGLESMAFLTIDRQPDVVVGLGLLNSVFQNVSVS